MKENRARVPFVLSVVLFGTVGTFLRFSSLSSEASAFYRGALGAVFLLLYRAVRRERPDFAAIRANLVPLLLSGVALGLNWIFLFAAYARTTVAIASLCNYMAPIFVIVLSPLILKEKPDPKKLPCVAAALLGIVLVSGVLGGGVGDPAGVRLGLTGACCFTALVFCNRRLKEISALDRTTVQLAVSALTVLPFVLVKSGGRFPVPQDLRSVLIALLIGAVQSGLAYYLYFDGMAVLPVHAVAILGYLEPVVSVLCSALVLREPLGLTGGIGAALILAAAVFSELTPRGKKAEKKEENA